MAKPWWQTQDDSVAPFLPTKVVDPTGAIWGEGNVNPFGSQGGSLGKQDIIGNQLDKWNPFVQKARAKREANAAANNTGPAPAYPEYSSLLDANGALKPPFAVDYRAGLGTQQAGYTPAGAAPVNRQALDALTSRGMAQGKSPWLQMMEGRVGQQQAGYMDDALKAGRGATTSALDTAASHGGLSGGAAARIGRAGAESTAQAQSAAAKWGADARAQAGLEDERTKLGILQQLPGQELALGQYQTGANQFDTGNQLRTDMFNVGNQNQMAQFNRGNDQTVDQLNAKTGIMSEMGRNLFNQQNWAEQMKAFAAGKQANAIGSSGKK